MTSMLLLPIVVGVVALALAVDVATLVTVLGCCWRRALQSAVEYDGNDDFSRSIDEAYREIRERVAAGGEPWRPK